MRRFKPRSFQRELALCQRYYEKTYDLETAPATATAVGQPQAQWSSSATFTNLRISIYYKVLKRAIPTTTFYDGAGSSGVWDNSTGVNVQSGLEGTWGFVINNSFASTTSPGPRGHFTADAEL